MSTTINVRAARGLSLQWEIGWQRKVVSSSGKERFDLCRPDRISPESRRPVYWHTFRSSFSVKGNMRGRMASLWAVIGLTFLWYHVHNGHETGFLNRQCERKPQVNLRSSARCSNPIGRGVQPDQWRALDLRLTWGLLPTDTIKKSTSARINFQNESGTSILSKLVILWTQIWIHDIKKVQAATMQTK